MKGKIDLKFCEQCFNNYYLSKNSKKSINIKDPITNNPLKEKEILKYANIYLKDDFKNNLKKIRNAKLFKIKTVSESEIIIYNDQKNIKINVNLDEVLNKENKKKEKEIVEKFLNDLNNSNIDLYSQAKITECKKIAFDYYIEKLISLENDKYKDIYEKFLLPKNHDLVPKKLKIAILKKINSDIVICQKLFDNFLFYYPLNKEPKAPNSTIEMIISKNILKNTPYEFLKLNRDDLIEILNNYSKYIVNKELLNQFRSGFRKFLDLKYDELKYNFDLYEGVMYNPKRLKKMYPNQNYNTIIKKANLFINSYLDETKKEEINNKNKEISKIVKENIKVENDYLVLFKKLSEFLTLDIACDYLEEQNIEIKKLKSEFENFKKYIKDKYSSLVIKDIEEKIDYYIKIKENFENFKKIIENICNDILSDPSKSKHDYFKAYHVNNEVEIEKLVSKYYPEIYARYIEKIKLLEKSEIDKILNKINDLGNNFTIFDYANITDLNIVKFLEKLYEFYPKNKENNLIMEMDFAKALTSMDMDINEYLQNDFYIALENDLYLLDENDKNDVISLLKNNNLPINAQTCKVAAKKILESKKKTIKSH